MAPVKDSYTRNEIKSIDDKIRRITDDLNDDEIAVLYTYLFAKGWRLEKAKRHWQKKRIVEK